MRPLYRFSDIIMLVDKMWSCNRMLHHQGMVFAVVIGKLIQPLVSSSIKDVSVLNKGAIEKVETKSRSEV